jgi:tetratricopeptide (TPR) repeat protein
MIRKIPAVLAAVAVLFFAGPALADDATELERAKTSYDAGRYAEGADRFKEILNPDSPNALKAPNAIERARAYYAACLIALGRTDEANQQIEKLLRNNPLYTPDPVIFPGKVTDRFIEVKSRLKGEIEDAFRVRADARAKIEKDQRAYIANLQRLAGQESVVVRHSRWIAMVPFGAGQFQNGQDGLGYAFLVSEAILAGTSITAGVIHMQLISDYSRNRTQVDYDDFISRKNATFNISVYSTAALGVLAAAGIVQSQIVFVPESRETRPRPVPAPPPVMPTVGGGPSGFVLGLQGRF